MFKRPSSRRKSGAEGVQLNLVPILDTMVTLIGFLLFTTSFIGFVSIESPFPTTDPEQQKKIEDKEKPLQLTVSLHEKDTEIWSPFERIKPARIPNVTPGQPDIKAIHEAMLGIKQQFPAEHKVILVPFAAANYDMLVAVMDALRMVEPTDPPIYAKDERTGNDAAVKQLFPDVLFGNLLSSGSESEGS